MRTWKKKDKKEEKKASTILKGKESGTEKEGLV